MEDSGHWEGTRYILNEPAIIVGVNQDGVQEEFIVAELDTAHWEHPPDVTVKEAIEALLNPIE